MKQQTSIMAIAAAFAVLACARGEKAPSTKSPSGAGEPEVSAEEASAIAEQAYVYAYPMMESYRTMYVQVIDTTAPSHMGGFNELVHATELLGPEFRDVVRPNNDTLYSTAWLDVRAQPVVLTVPRIEGRYYSVQLIDMFTHNFAYIGTRTTGTEPGSYVIAGPQWQGHKPGDVKEAFRSESSFVYCIIRTEVRAQEDLPAAREIQKRYLLTAMHVFLGRSRAPAASGITFPSYDPGRATSAAFINLLNFLLAQVAIAPGEQELMSQFARIGIRPGALSASLTLSEELRHAIDAGVGRGIIAITRAAEHPSMLQGVTVRAERGWVGIDGLFGDGKTMRTKYLTRAVAAMVGLYGNDASEAYYPMSKSDASGNPLDGSKHDYVLRFEKDELPQVDAFWSITMYSLPDQLLVANSMNRYSIGDRSELQYGNDGSLTIYIQHEAPDRNERNWLPAPDGPFSLQLRMYLPKAETLDPLYLPPAVQVAE
jgi:hypothetical protein